MPDVGVDLDDVLAGVERTLIRQALERTGGNKRQAAQSAAAEAHDARREAETDRQQRSGPSADGSE